ncbi:protein kinase [Myxococcota bacterium]|nr:protein kinase [Myxococcota bacterium]MBU1510047.1 protein kinase [Myxococcota bacterium]
MSQDDTEALIGTTIGNYEIKSLLGAGAMGQVFLGEHPHIGRKVAVKVLMASFSSNPEMADRFMSEAKAVNKINNPNIIQVFDFGKLPDGRLYLVMEFLEGVELSGYMETRGTVSIDDTIELMGQIASALDAAHNAGIVHRDLKPDNIFVVEGPTGPVIKVLDFGVAKLLDPAMGGKHKTATGLIMGTPSYMSPEQARGSGAMIGPATDIYALGVIVYQMLSGHLPIDAESVTQVLLKHITDPPTPIFEFLPAFPPMLWDVIERSLDKNIDARPPSASAFHHMFSEAARGIPSHITAVGMVSPIPARSTFPGLNTSAVKTSMTGEQIAVGGGRSAMLWVVILLVIAGIGGGVWWFGLRDKGEMKPAAPVAANNMAPADMPVADMPVEPMPPDAMPVEPVVEKKTFKLKVGSDKPGIEFKMKINDEPEVELRTPFEHTLVEGSRVLITPNSSDYAQQSLTVTKDEVLQLVSTAPAPMSVMGTSPMPPPMTAPMDVTPDVMKPMSVGEDTIKIMF